MGCSKNYIMYWGVFTVIIVPYVPRKVCTNRDFFHLILIQNNDEFFRRFGFSVLICTNARKITEKNLQKTFFVLCRFSIANKKISDFSRNFRCCSCHLCFLLKNGFEFSTAQLLFFHQLLCTLMQHIGMLQNNLFRLIVAFLDHLADFLVDGCGYILAVALRMAPVAADEDSSESES